MSNILDRARAIVYDRSEEKERQYGPFRESMKRAAAIYNNMTWGAQATDIDMYKALIALKLSREGFAHKEDNLLDAIAYMASMNDALEEDARNEKDPADDAPEIPEVALDFTLVIATNQASFDLALNTLYGHADTGFIKDRDGNVLVEIYVDKDPETLEATLVRWFNKELLDKYKIKY